MIKIAWIKKIKAFLPLILLTASLLFVLGGTANAVSDKSLIQLSGDTKVYWLQNNKIYHVYDANVLNTMQSAAIPGWSWSSITTVSSLSSYTVGPEFITTSSVSNGLLIRKYGGTDVYYIGSGKKEYLSSTTFSTRGYSFSDVIDVPQSYLDMFSTLSLDLTISATVNSSYTSAQSSVQIPVTVYRTGDSLISATYVMARLYWSTNSSWDGSDTKLWESNGSTPDYPISYLNSNGSKQVTATVNIPSVSAGTYYILAVVDPESYHTENNENNNIVAYTVTVGTDAAPNSPSTLSQYKTDGTSITAGGTTNESSIKLRGYVSDPDGNQVKLQVEIITTSQNFSGNPTNESSYVSSGSTAEITVSGLSNGNYQWRGRTIDSTGKTSSWVDAGYSGADFIVSLSSSATLIQKSGDYKVYYVSNGYKYHIPDPETFEILGFSWSGITTVTQDTYTEGSSIPALKTGNAKDGSLIKRTTGSTSYYVYLIENGLKRHIPDPDTFYAMGRSFNEVITLDDTLFDRIPLGNDVPSVNSAINDFLVFISESYVNASVSDSGVDAATGNYVYPKTHLVIPGRGIPFVFSTTYNAKDSYDSVMGQGWTHSYNITATEIQKDGVNLFTRIKWGDGHEELYKWDGASYKALFGVYNTFTGGGGSGSIAITTKAQIKYMLERIDSPETISSQDSNGNSTTITKSRYRLKTITDRNSNTITVNYTVNNDPLKWSVTDTVGRTISFTNEQTTLNNVVVTRLKTITDPINRTVEFTYDYTTDGRITKIKDMNGGYTTLAYDTNKKMGIPNPLIKTITDPRGNTCVNNSYTDDIASSNNKKATSVSICGSARDVTYSGDTTSINDKSSNITMSYVHDPYKRMTGYAPTGNISDKIALAYKTPTNLSDFDPNPTSITDRMSKQTSFTYDANGNVTKITDALNNATNFEYDGMNNVTKKTDPLYRVTTYTYDSKGVASRIIPAKVL